jgi:transposase, IS5 family
MIRSRRSIPEPAMRPKSAEPQTQPELFCSRLDNLIDRRHPLVRLTGLIDWARFETAFGELYRDGVGRPALPTRLMVALHLLKHMDGLSDEAVCARYLDSPYVQFFCGEAYFQHALPLDRSSMTRWRKRIGVERMQTVLAESLAAAQRGGAVEAKHFRRVIVDTTVQPKAVTHPTDSKLLHRGIEILARMARRHSVPLRQSYVRVGRQAKREAARLMHGGRNRQAEREVRRLRTWLGRLARDIGRKIAGNRAAEAAFATPLALIGRLRSACRQVLCQTSRMGRQGLEPSHDHHQTAFGPGIFEQHEGERPRSLPPLRRDLRDDGDTGAERHHAAGRVQPAHPHARSDQRARPRGMCRQVAAERAVAREAHHLAAQGLDESDTPALGERVPLRHDEHEPVRAERHDCEIREVGMVGSDTDLRQPLRDGPRDFGTRPLVQVHIHTRVGGEEGGKDLGQIFRRGGGIRQ